MMHLSRLWKIFIAVWVISLIVGYGADKQQLEKRFTDVATLQIELISSNCEILADQTDQVTVKLEYTVEPPGAFKPEMRVRGNTLILEEHWYGASRGEVLWTISLPARTAIEYESASGDLFVNATRGHIEAESASGDLSLMDCQGEFELETASGDLELDNCSGEWDLSSASGDMEFNYCTGEMDLSTASGDIELSQCQGVFDISTASGDMELSGLQIQDASEFSAASGDIALYLTESLSQDLYISTASGDILLDYGGNPLQGYFEFTAKKRPGRIQSGHAFDREEEFERGQYSYTRKSFTVDQDHPQIYLKTHSGKIKFKR